MAVGPYSANSSSSKPHRLGRQHAAAAAINSPADGYTLLFVAPNNAISTSPYKKLPYDFLRDTAPVASIMQLTNMLVVSNAMLAKTVKEFIDYCKANPGKISFGSSGNGTSVHMTAELFKVMTKCDMVHVPYRGSAIAFPDIISNKVQLIFDNHPSALEQVQGRQRYPLAAGRDLAAALAKRAGRARDRRDRAGLRERSASTASPRRRRTPSEVDRDPQQGRQPEALKDPKLVAKLPRIGGLPKAMTPAEFGKLVADETEKWRKVVEFAGVDRLAAPGPVALPMSTSVSRPGPPKIKTAKQPHAQ